MEREAQLSGVKAAERAAIQQGYDLAAAASIRDRSLTLFNRTGWGLGNGGTFAAVDFLEDMRQLGWQDVAILGVPLDAGTTYRSGTRFGPQAIRQLFTLGGNYNAERGVVLTESL